MPHFKEDSKQIKFSPKVSILVPVYNVAPYLRDCLNSLVNQTLKDIEIICVNDGSTDESLTILNEYANKYNFIKVVNKPNGGLPSARNAGLNVACGEYVGFVDSDDFVSLGMYKIMYDSAIKDHSEIVVCGGIPFPQNPQPDAWLTDVLSPRKIRYAQCTSFFLFEEKGVRPFIWRMLVKRSLIEQNNIRLNENIILGEDQGFQFAVYPLANGISLIPDKLYHYRWCRTDSLMSTLAYSDLSVKVDKHITLISHLISVMNKNNSWTYADKDFWICFIDLIYNDFIKLSWADRVRLSKRIYPICKDANIWKWWFDFPLNTREKIEYILSLREDVPLDPLITVVISCNNSYNCIQRCLNSVCKQNLKNIEIVCVNNAMNDGSYVFLYKLLNSDHRVSILNQNKLSDVECWRNGTNQASTELVMYLNSSDYIISADALSSIVSAVEPTTDALFYNLKNSFSKISKGIKVNSDKIFELNALDSFPSINQAVFRKSSVVSILNSMKDYSFMNESVFIYSFLSTAPRIQALDSYVYYHNAQPIPDSIACWQSNLILDGCLKILELNSIVKVGWINEYISNLLDSDVISRLIVNSTMPYVGDINDNGKSAEAGTWCKIVDLNNRLNRSDLPQSELLLIKGYLEMRHRFLHNLSVRK